MTFPIYGCAIYVNAMPIRILTVPFDPAHDLFQDEDLSKFLLNKRVKTLRPEFFQLDGRAFWSVFVEYESVMPDTSSRRADDLNEPQRLLYQRLREWRKEAAERDGFPVFLLATNSQLTEIVKQAPRSLEALRQIRGFGKKKLTRYGEQIVGIVTAFYAPEETRQ